MTRSVPLGTSSLARLTFTSLIVSTVSFDVLTPVSLVALLPIDVLNQVSLVVLLPVDHLFDVLTPWCFSLMW